MYGDTKRSVLQYIQGEMKKHLIAVGLTLVVLALIIAGSLLFLAYPIQIVIGIGIIFAAVFIYKIYSYFLEEYEDSRFNS